MPAPHDIVGTTVLHYRVLREIGSGGMGVVYEADDTKLGRRVALKFLPRDLSGDAVALERFVREARAASALNHPNISTVYAIEEAAGARFIAMELLEGESLDRRSASRLLTWDALIEIGVQIADALDAAHRRGIVHRDIKPGNIFVTTDGRAKVLDFGVAKMAMGRVAQAETVGAASFEHALTGEGVSVGTIAYMSPEQARGEELDGRTDIFSLAAVLYEMSTGRRAFEGQTSAVVFNRILEGTPTPPRELNPTLPPRLEDVILRGLEKDRELRYQSAADLRADLKRLRRDATAGRLAFVPPAAGGRTAPLSSGAVLVAEARRHKGLAGTAAVFVLALIGAAGYGLQALFRQPPESPAGAAIAARGTPERLTTSGDVRGCGSISPDGKYVVYCDFRGQLKLRQVATGATVALGALTGDTTFSPDSNFVYVTERSGRHPSGVLWAIPSLGGEPRRVLTDLAGPVALSSDGQHIAFVRPRPGSGEAALMIADTRGGNERRVAASNMADTWFEGLGVSWSPDATRVSLTQSTVVGGYRMRPAVVRVDTGEVQTLGSRTWAEMGRTAWLPGNSAILFTAREHLASPFQFWIARYPDGAVTQITSDARGFGNLSVSVTADGTTVATVPNDTVSNIWSTNADATAPLEQWTSGVRFDGGSGMAPTRDGRLYFASHDGAEMGIWSVDGPGRQPRKLTQHYGEVPSLPDDGSFLVYQAIHDGRFRIWRADPDGGNARALSRGEDDIMPSVSPDGKWIYYWSAGGAKLPIMRMAPDGSEPAVVSDLPVQLVDVSPDGREILVRAIDSSLQASHLILDAATGAVKAKFDFDDARVGWGRTADRLTYIVDRDGVGNLWERPVSGGESRQLTHFMSGAIFHFAYSPDRTRLFLARGQRTGDVVVIRNFR